MEFQEYAIASFVIIGLVNGVQLAFNKEWASFAKFMVAVIAATAFGYFKLFGLEGIETGLQVGISSSGIYKLAQKIGN